MWPVPAENADALAADVGGEVEIFPGRLGLLRGVAVTRLRSRVPAAPAVGPPVPSPTAPVPDFGRTRS